MLNNVFPKIMLVCDNVEKYCRTGQATDNDIIRMMRFACRITKTTDTHLKYVMLVFARQKWVRTGASVVTL